jgi:hypothetical protein
MKIVCDMRVSTAKQGHSGLGIEAQQQPSGIIKRSANRSVWSEIQSRELNEVLLILSREQNLSVWL